MFTALKAAVCAVAFSMLVFADEPPTPSSNMLHFRGTDIELNYPENWQASENSGFVYLTPPGGFTDGGDIAYGMLIGTFEPDESLTLEDATDQIIAQYRLWNQNITMVRYAGRTRINGVDATVFDLLNESPAFANGMETDKLITVLRPDGVVTYFVAIAPDLDLQNYNPAFNRVLGSVRFRS
jgi:hypothetical protein